MGFIDKLKAGAEEAAGLAGQAAGQAKELAEKTASRAKQEARELQLKRDLSDAYDDLGRTAFELWEAGEITSPLLESRAGRIKTLREQLDELSEEPADEETAEGERPAAEASGDAGEPGAERTDGSGRAEA